MIILYYRVNITYVKISVSYIVLEWIILYMWAISILTLTFSTGAFSSYPVRINVLNHFLMNKGF